MTPYMPKSKWRPSRVILRAWASRGHLWPKDRRKRAEERRIERKSARRESILIIEDQLSGFERSALRQRAHDLWLELFLYIDRND